MTGVVIMMNIVLPTASLHKQTIIQKECIIIARILVVVVVVVAIMLLGKKISPSQYNVLKFRVFLPDNTSWGPLLTDGDWCSGVVTGCRGLSSTGGRHWQVRSTHTTGHSQPGTNNSQVSSSPLTSRYLLGKVRDTMWTFKSSLVFYMVWNYMSILCLL